MRSFCAIIVPSPLKLLIASILIIIVFLGTVEGGHLFGEKNLNVLVPIVPWWEMSVFLTLPIIIAQTVTAVSSPFLWFIIGILYLYVFSSLIAEALMFASRGRQLYRLWLVACLGILLVVPLRAVVPLLINSSTEMIGQASTPEVLSLFRNAIAFCVPLELYLLCFWYLLNRFGQKHSGDAEALS